MGRSQQNEGIPGHDDDDEDEKNPEQHHFGISRVDRFEEARLASQPAQAQLAYRTRTIGKPFDSSTQTG
jgi:hypothetical protein